MQRSGPMRLVWATYNFFPERFGGTEVYAAAAARVLQGLGHSVRVIAGTMKPAASPRVPFELRGATYEGIPVSFFAFHPQAFLRSELLSLESEALTRWWGDWFAARPCDLLHLHGYSPACSVSLVAAAKQAGIPVALSFHHPGLICARGDFVQAWGNPCGGELRVARCALCFGLTRIGNPATFRPSGEEPAGREGAGQGAHRGIGSKLRTAVSLPWQFQVRRRAWRRLVSLVDGWHAFSEPTKRLLLRNGVPESRVRVIPHGMEPLPSPPRPPSAEIRAGYVGRFHPEKGTRLLIRAIRRVDPRLPMKFIFFGRAQDPQEQAVETELKELERADRRVILRGAFPPARTAEIFAELDLLVVPSLAFETGPLVVLEAFRAGIPVIGPCWGSLPSLVRDGVNGLLFPWGDARALAQRLERIGQEPGLLKRLQAGVRPPDSVEAHVGRLLEFYREL